MPPQTTLEPHGSLEELLLQRLSQDNLLYLADRYARIKNHFKKSAPFINARNPLFTDHSTGHSKSVQDIIHELISQRIDQLNTIEIYILCCATYFHDWGNIISRKNHRSRVPELYQTIFAPEEQEFGERQSIISIVKAHTGTSIDGDLDTLKDIETNMRVLKNTVNAQRLAAILRLTDELAESKDRTSLLYMKETDLPDESLLHHFYSYITDIHFDCQAGRILITYHIGYIKDGVSIKTTCVGTGKHLALGAFLEFIAERLSKTNDERHYTKYYLRNFLSLDEISASLKFCKIMCSSTGECFGEETHVHRISMTDKIIPGSAPRPTLDIGSILSKLD